LSRTGAAVGRANGHGQEFTPSLVGGVDSSVNHSFEVIRRSRGPSVECPRLAHPTGRPYDRFRSLLTRPRRLLCPRFEGVDERVTEARGLIEVSIRDYVLFGGEIAALAVLDACIRPIPRRDGQ
jgi:tRNA G37 N-methylase TrmD